MRTRLSWAAAITAMLRILGLGVVGRAAIAAVCVLAAMTASAHALEATEAAVEAAFLFKFGFFVEWPASAFASGDSPMTLCIVGDDPFGALLDDAVKGQKIGNRPVVVRRMSAVSRDSGCHIVYLSETGNSPPETLAALRGSDVLTVTDSSADDSAVGIINFVIKDNHVRFDIDDAAAASGGLVISSRLLNIALDVKPRH